MTDYKNEGYDPADITDLKEECAQEGKPFVHVEDDDLLDLEPGECVHIQFPGVYEGQEVIYDALIYTLRLHHGMLVYESAVEQVKKTFPDYRPIEEREPGYSITPEKDDEAELLLTEIMDELEETEAIKVQEHIDTDLDSDYGIALEVGLHRDEITDEVIEQFVTAFNAGTPNLDTTLYSYSSADDFDE